jgi:FkbM family methyltransferase
LIWCDDFQGKKNFHQGSQDAWFFKGNTIVRGGHFYMGQPNCDTRLAWLIHMSGNRLLNKGLTANLAHIHHETSRNYTKSFLPTPVMHCNTSGENKVSFHPIARWRKNGLTDILFWKWDVTRSLFSSPPEFFFTSKFYTQKAIKKIKSILRQLSKKVILQTPIARDIYTRKCLNDAKKSQDGKLFEFLDFLFSERDKWVFFDIGANNGSSTIRYCSCFRNANAHLFEAHPQIVEEAIKNIKQSSRGKRISIHSFAISNEDATAQFFVSKIPTKKGWRQNHSDSSSLLEPGEHKTLFPGVAFEDTIEVPTKRLDNLISNGEIPIPHFIHMDIQGAEKLALEGLGTYLVEVEAIWMEVSNCELYKNQVQINEIETIMRENGFKKEIDTVNEVFGDQLWLNTKARYPNA